jgi:hypothetical protein
MPLDPKQRRKLLMADRTRDAAWITAAIEHLVAADPTVTLDEIEGALRDAAGSAYVVAGERFEVVIGMPAMLAAVATVGMTPLENWVALARKTGRSRRGGVTASERRRPRILGRPSISPRAIGIRYRAACIPLEVDQGFRPSCRRTGWSYRPPADKGHRENFARCRPLVATASHQSRISAQIAKPQKATNQKSESQMSRSSRFIVGARFGEVPTLVRVQRCGLGRPPSTCARPTARPRWLCWW